MIRLRIEHVFADQKSQTGLFVRIVGLTRATMRIGLASIVYNMHRFIFLERINQWFFDPSRSLTFQHPQSLPQ